MGALGWLVQAVPFVALGSIGWVGARQLRIPAAGLLGPLVLVAVVTGTGLLHADFPNWIKSALQVIVGSFLGWSFDREAFGRIRSLGKPIVIATAWMILSALLIGLLLAWVIQIDLITSFLSTSPGGTAEMSAMALSTNRNVAFVATLQVFRLFSSLLAIPLFVRSVAADTRSVRADETAAPAARPRSTPIPATGRGASTGVGAERYSTAIWLVVGAAGAVIFTWFHIPAAGVVGSMVGVAAARNMGLSLSRPSRSLRTAAQIGLGILIGASFDQRTIALLRDEFFVIVLVTAATLVSSLGLAGVVERALDVDRRTALLACAPGGLTQMGIIADEIGAQANVVNMFQLARLLVAVLILPLLIYLIA